MKPHRFNPNRRGYSLLETLMAASVLAVVMVPALALMKTGLEASRDVETADLLTTLCVSKMEEHLARISVDFTSQTFTGDFSAVGQGGLRYDVTQSDATADGGIEDRLMVLTATVWDDANSDTVADADELAVTLTTKVAKMALYQSTYGGG